MEQGRGAQPGLGGVKQLDRNAGMVAGNRSRSDIVARLEPYWKMEAGNAALIPIAILLVSKAQIGWVSLVPMAAMVLLLVIGAMYWHGKVRMVRGEIGTWPNLMRRLDLLRAPALLLSLAGSLVALAGWVKPELSVGLADRLAATGCAVLAVLEYINYYHRQLQHFDNRADFQRLLTGRGFRPSWMARDLAEWRRSRSG